MSNPPNNVTDIINNVKYIKLIDNQPSTVTFFNNAQTIAQSIDPTADFIAYNCVPLNNPVYNVKPTRPYLIEEWHNLMNSIPYVQIFLNNFHSCYDVTLEFKTAVTNVSCDLVVGGVHHLLSCTQIAPNKFELSDFTLANQLLGSQKPYARYMLVKFDGIALNTPVVTVSGTVCNYANLSAFAPTDASISMVPSK